MSAEQQAQSAPTSSSSAPAEGLTSFVLKTSDIRSMHNLLYLFEQGWPVQAGTQPKTYPPMVDAKLAAGVLKGPRAQLDNMRQGYRLLKVISDDYSISRQQAAAAVDLWREFSGAAIIQPDGTISRAAADSSLPSGSKEVPRPAQLRQPKSSAALSLNAVCEDARGMQEVQRYKDGRKADAGRAGGQASKRQKRQGSCRS